MRAGPCGRLLQGCPRDSREPIEGGLGATGGVCSDAIDGLIDHFPQRLCVCGYGRGESSVGDLAESGRVKHRFHLRSHERRRALVRDPLRTVQAGKIVGHA